MVVVERADEAAAGGVALRVALRRRTARREQRDNRCVERHVARSAVAPLAAHPVDQSGRAFASAFAVAAAADKGRVASTCHVRGILPPRNGDGDGHHDANRVGVARVGEEHFVVCVTH